MSTRTNKSKNKKKTWEIKIKWLKFEESNQATVRDIWELKSNNRNLTDQNQTIIEFRGQNYF
jgi:hypothetical protein